MTIAPEQLDENKVEEFSERILSLYVDNSLTYMIDIGYRTGLFEAATEGPATSAELAARAGLTERYVREWLGALTTGGVFGYDETTKTYTLPPEHAVCLSGDTEFNLAPMSIMGALLAKTLGDVAQAFREGGGVPYSGFPEFTEAMDQMSRQAYDAVLVGAWLPLADGLTERLRAGTRVADVGCGSGHAVNVLAREFPASNFTGYDISDEGIDRARKEASDFGVSNASFETVDVAQLRVGEPFDVAFAFDAIHDQVDPAAVLARVFESLAPGGTFVMVDIKAASALEENLDNPFAPLLYSVSTLHCLTVSLAHGGAGLGTVWGQELAFSMLADAGFVGAEVHDTPGDPMNCLYVASKPI